MTWLKQTGRWIPKVRSSLSLLEISLPAWVLLPCCAPSRFPLCSISTGIPPLTIPWDSSKPLCCALVLSRFCPTCGSEKRLDFACRYRTHANDDQVESIRHDFLEDHELQSEREIQCIYLNRMSVTIWPAEYFSFIYSNRPCVYI